MNLLILCCGGPSSAIDGGLLLVVLAIVSIPFVVPVVAGVFIWRAVRRSSAAAARQAQALEARGEAEADLRSWLATQSPQA